MFVFLYSHVLDCSAERVRENAVPDMFFAQAEVGQFDVALGVQQDVFRFQVSVHDPEKVQMFDGEQNLG